MVTLDEMSNEDEQTDSEVVDNGRPRAPTFMDVLSSDTGADYDTDLEEDFPGCYNHRLPRKLTVCILVIVSEIKQFVKD